MRLLHAMATVWLELNPMSSICSVAFFLLLVWNAMIFDAMRCGDLTFSRRCGLYKQVHHRLNLAQTCLKMKACPVAEVGKAWSITQLMTSSSYLEVGTTKAQTSTWMTFGHMIWNRSFGSDWAAFISKVHPSSPSRKHRWNMCSKWVQ